MRCNMPLEGRESTMIKQSFGLLAALALAGCGILGGDRSDPATEGVTDAMDVQALWDCNVDGITGPWASAQVGSSSGRTTR